MDFLYACICNPKSMVWIVLPAEELRVVNLSTGTEEGFMQAGISPEVCT